MCIKGSLHIRGNELGTFRETVDDDTYVFKN